MASLWGNTGLKDAGYSSVFWGDSFILRSLGFWLQARFVYMEIVILEREHTAQKRDDTGACCWLWSFHIQISCLSTMKLSLGSFFHEMYWNSQQCTQSFPFWLFWGEVCMTAAHGWVEKPRRHFPFQSLFAANFPQQWGPTGKGKGSLTCLPESPVWIQTVFTASTIDSCLFSPSFSSLIELLVSSLHILLGWCICIYSSMCVRLFFPLFSFLFASDCTSDFSTGNDKDTTRQLTASPGYIANSSFAFSKAYFW